MFENTIKELIEKGYKQDEIDKNKFTKFVVGLSYIDKYIDMEKETKLVVLLKDNYIEIYNEDLKGQIMHTNKNGTGKTFFEAFENWLQLEREACIRYDFEQNKDQYEEINQKYFNGKLFKTVEDLF